MKPCNFKESNKILQKPTDMIDEECQSLPIFTDKNICVSKWKMNWPERLHCLFSGFVWVFVRSKNTQPPIVVMAYKSAFETINHE